MGGVALSVRWFLSSSIRTVPRMPHTATPPMDLLATVAAQPGVPADRIDAETYAVAVRYGWVYEHRGRVGLTVAGAWHAGQGQRGGLLPDSHRS
jgi:hypothetical protein